MNIRRILMSALIFASSGWLGPLAHAAVVSMNAGRVADVVVTTREVVIHHLIEVALSPKPTPALLKEVISLEHPRARDFVRETTTVLLENAIFLEAESVGAAPLEKDKIQAAQALVQKKMRRNSAWLKLEVGPEELKRILTRSLRAKDFIKFKVDSAAIPISDHEAEEYFNNNRLKFENLPFANFRENIRAYLTKQQVDKRLKEWFELLQSKYRIRNHLGG